MSAKVKTKTDKPVPESVMYSDRAVRANMAVIEYCRTSMAALAGCTAGILGLTSIYGFLFCIVCNVVLWAMLLLKAGSSWPKYFFGRRALLTSGIFSGMFTYVLFWVFLYGMVHVY